MPSVYIANRRYRPISFTLRGRPPGSRNCVTESMVYSGCFTSRSNVIWRADVIFLIHLGYGECDLLWLPARNSSALSGVRSLF